MHADGKDQDRARRQRRIDAGHGADCERCGKALTVEQPGYGWSPGKFRCGNCAGGTWQQVESSERGHDNVKCSWCDTPFITAGFGVRQRSCSKYCGIRHSRAGGHTWRGAFTTGYAGEETNPRGYHMGEPACVGGGVCQQCGESFISERKTAKYCGSACRTAAYRVRSANGQPNTY